MKKTCPNGHIFETSSDCPTCPVCEQAKQHNPEFPKLSKPAHRALENAGIRKLTDLAQWAEADLLSLHGVGPSAILPLKAAMKKCVLLLNQRKKEKKMKESKGKLIAYWIVTVLVAANYGFAAFSYISQNEQVKMGAAALGYPVYFFVMLGVWKALGAIAILIPKTPVIKEWAYAGMFINLIGASVSCAVMGFEKQHVIMPLVVLAFVIASWALRPASRRTEKLF